MKQKPELKTSVFVFHGINYECFHYDLNGNITNLVRNGNLTGGSQQMDSLEYFYYASTNRLDYVDDYQTSSGRYTGDVEAMTSLNYDYDGNGNLISDVSENISNIEWDVREKMRKVERSSGTKSDLEFVYDAMGNRIVKIVKSRAGGSPVKQHDWIYTYYVRDAQGNVMATYTRSFDDNHDGSFDDHIGLKDHSIYGSSRVGLVDGAHVTAETGTFTATEPTIEFVSPSYSVTPSPSNCSSTCKYSRTLTRKTYELSNHLGNVLVTISDKRIPYDNVASNSVVDYYKADPTSYTDYYAFGNPEPNRNGNSSSYRYGFNGKEKDDEISVDGGNYDLGERILDARLGRFLSTDPKEGEYPMQSTYAVAMNNPVFLVDINGEGVNPNGTYTVEKGQGASQIAQDAGITTDQLVQNNPTIFPKGLEKGSYMLHPNDVLQLGKIPQGTPSGNSTNPQSNSGGSTSGSDDNNAEKSSSDLYSKTARTGAGVTMAKLGENSIPVAGKTGGATAGTSPVSRFLSKLLPQNISKTKIYQYIPKRVVGFALRSPVLGRTLGRFVPIVGWGLILYDAVSAAYKVTDSAINDDAKTFYDKNREYVTTIGLYDSESLPIKSK